MRASICWAPLALVSLAWLGCSSGGPSASTTTDAGATDASTPPPISASDYAQTCSVDSDCAVLYEGAVCAVCRCTAGAIQKSESAKAQADLEERQKSCGPMPAIACAPCPAVVAYCNAGTCAAKNPADAGADASSDAAAE